MAIYIQLKRSSTQNNVNSHHLNQAELSKLCTLQKHSTLHYIKHCHHVLWMSYSAVSTFCECQFCITVLSAHSVNISFALQCCQHVLWISVLHYSAVSTFCECQFCVTVLSAHSVNVSFVSQCCQHVLWMSVLYHSAVSTFCECQFCGNKTLPIHQQQKAQQSILLPGYTAAR